MGSLVTSARWGSVKKAKKDMTGSELRHFYLQNSEVFVNFSMKGPNLEAVYIELRGAIGRIPNMKNSKIKGMFLNKDTRARIEAMDILYRQCEQPPVTFYDRQIHLTLICGHRSGRFDLVGCIETIQDWLEPAQRAAGGSSKSRGWGIGLIEDDVQITPMAVHSQQTGLTHEHSIVILRPWESMQEAALNVLAQSYLVGGSKNE